LEEIIVEIMSKSTTEEKPKPKLQLRSRQAHPADAYPNTEFLRLVKEACAVTRKVRELEGLASHRLTAKALLRETVEVGGTTIAKVHELRKLIEKGTPGFEDSVRSLRRSITFLESQRWSTAPRDPRSLNWLFSEATKHELSAKGYSGLELFCVAVEKAGEESPEVFGSVESSEEHSKNFAAAKARQEELYALLNTSYTADDLLIGELDRAGRATVTFKLSEGQVLVAPQRDAGERLVAHLISKGW